MLKQRIFSLFLSLLVITTSSIGSLSTTVALAAQGDLQIKFQTAENKDAFSIAGNGSQGTFVKDKSADKVSFLVEKNGQGVSFQNGANAVLGYIKLSAPQRWKIENSAHKALFELVKEPDGHFKFKDGTDKVLYVVRIEEYGCKVENAAKEPIYKIHRKNGVLSMKNEEGKVVLSCHSETSAMTMACFGFDALDNNQKAALAYTISFVRN